MRRFIPLSVVAVTAASLAAIVAPAVAQAATAPIATFAFSQTSVGQGSRAQITYVTNDVPSGSAIYVQAHQVGKAGGWVTVDRLGADEGIVRAPALVAGVYRFRVAVVDAGHLVTASAPETLTVTRPAGSSGCGICHALAPWLPPAVFWLLGLLFE